MLYLCIILGCIFGVLLGVNMPVISYTYSSYVAIAIVAAMDTVLGGISSYIQKKFDIKIFITGFFGNAILSILLTYLGNKLNVDITKFKQDLELLNNKTLFVVIMLKKFQKKLQIIEKNPRQITNKKLLNK